VEGRAGLAVEYAFPNVAAVLGYAPEAFTRGGLSYAAVVHPEDLERVAGEVAERGAAGASSFEQAYRVVRADGGVRCLDAFTTVVRGPTGPPRTTWATSSTPPNAGGPSARSRC
jgi:PAS domain-containing protein